MIPTSRAARKGERKKTVTISATSDDGTCAADITVCEHEMEFIYENPTEGARFLRTIVNAVRATANGRSDHGAGK